LAALREAVERLGGRLEEMGGELRLVFDRRGFSLVDLPLEALRELLGFDMVVIVEKGHGKDGMDYYYYVKKAEVERLIAMLEAEARQKEAGTA
jgi:hypothetical protein